MFSHNGASGAESKTTLHFVDFLRWRHRGEVCCQPLPGVKISFFFILHIYSASSKRASQRMSFRIQCQETGRLAPSVSLTKSVLLSRLDAVVECNIWTHWMDEQYFLTTHQLTVNSLLIRILFSKAHMSNKPDIVDSNFASSIAIWRTRQNTSRNVRDEGHAVLSLKKLGAPSHHLPLSLIPSLSLPTHSLP